FSSQLFQLSVPTQCGFRTIPSPSPVTGIGVVCAKATPLLVIPKPGLSARNLLGASSEAADSSRDNAALRNRNSLGIFKITPLRGNGTSSKQLFRPGLWAICASNRGLAPWAHSGATSLLVVNLADSWRLAAESSELM